MKKKQTYAEREEAVLAHSAEPKPPTPEDDQRRALVMSVAQMLVEMERGRRSERAKAARQRRKQRAAQADASEQST